MKSAFTYEPAMSDADQAGYARVLAHSFARAEKDSAEWIARFPRRDTRVLKVGDRVVAGLIMIPMGQFYGGASVLMTGIAAVGTAPEARGRGVALEMMKRCVLELREMGVPISALYPATQRLYRLAGWEQSGHRCEVRLPLARIGIRDLELDVREMEDADRPRGRSSTVQRRGTSTGTSIVRRSCGIVSSARRRRAWTPRGRSWSRGAPGSRGTCTSRSRRR